MTGYFVRVKRDSGPFASVDIAEMTDAELDRLFDDQIPVEKAVAWAKALARWIRDNVKVKEEGNEQSQQSIKTADPL